MQSFIELDCAINVDRLGLLKQTLRWYWYRQDRRYSLLLYSQLIRTCQSRFTAVLRVFDFRVCG
jgi:hypothetical protein